MARSLIQRRQEAERARVKAYEASLRRVSQRERAAPDFYRAIADARDGFEAAIVRDPWAWRPQMKTRDAGRLRLAAARYLFARYPVAEHLEQVWLNPGGLNRDEIKLRKRWYIVAAGGGSLYREGASAWLSRKEVHAFLNPLGRLGFDAAIWQAIARSYADDPAIAMRTARSRIVDTPRAELGFWREAVRFFCAHPTTVEEMDDVRDYLEDCRQRNADFSLKGRTLASLRRQMREWHRDLEAIARIEAARRREAARARARGGASRSRGARGRQLAGCCDHGLVVDPGGQGSVRARGVSGGSAQDGRRSACRDAGHAPLRRELRGKVHRRNLVDLVAAPPRRRQDRAASHDRARPPLPRDPGSGVRQPHGAHRRAQAPGALGQGARDRSPIVSAAPPDGAALGPVR
jgi:hypothetical protein